MFRWHGFILSSFVKVCQEWEIKYPPPSLVTVRDDVSCGGNVGGDQSLEGHYPWYYPPSGPPLPPPQCHCYSCAGCWAFISNWQCFRYLVTKSYCPKNIYFRMLFLKFIFFGTDEFTNSLTYMDITDQWSLTMNSYDQLKVDYVHYIVTLWWAKTLLDVVM